MAIRSEPGYRLDPDEPYSDPRVKAALAAYDAAIAETAAETGEVRMADRLEAMRRALAGVSRP